MKRALLFAVALLTGAACNSQPGQSTQAAGSSPAAATAWQPFQDPAENCFKMQVPKGWKIAGGAYRFGPLDTRAMIDMISPDGKTNIRFGDSHVPPYSGLTPLEVKLGWREGHPYSPNNMSQGIIANYRPGWVYADLYGQARFASMCRHLSLKSMQKANPVHPDGQNMTTTAGEVVYACDSAAGPKVAYVFAETQLFELQGTRNWLVTWLYSFIAPQDQAGDAMKTMMKSLSTFETNPQWEYKQLQIDGQATEVAMKTFQQSMAQIRSNYEQKSAAMQQQEESFDRVIRGVDLTTDPIDGRQREVWMGTGGSHWINGLNQVVNSPAQPGPNYRQLKTEP